MFANICYKSKSAEGFVMLIKQMKDDTVERRTMLRLEENSYLIERTVKCSQV